MALDPRVRKILTRAVDACRAELEADTRDQLERVFGFQRSGVPRPIQSLPLDPRELAIGESLREWHRHLTGLFQGTPEQRQYQARERMLTETAFTVLHRLVALRMMEERGVLPVPVLRSGEQSEGFRLYALTAQGGLGDNTATYRIFLERVFDEVAGDLGSIFDRREPASLVFPSESCLRTVVGRLIDPELAEAWGDDETIGWVYQDFHSAEERKEMRRGKEIPENGYELAVRNQLFTPRWVVEFLTDNTLGQIWLGMNDGESPLREDLPSLHRGEPRLPIPRKDPRDLRVLDPACGSGHFLLYAYDVLERIYEDAWQRSYSAPGRKSLREDYPDHTAFRRELPALILRHNLFGVDIDRRPLQVAALALWLRAQRAWREENVGYADRPAITRTNLVCAEPMPGDAKVLEEFTAGLKPPVLGELVRQVWSAMRPVGEMGLLLRIDREIKSAVKDARDAWTGVAPSAESGELFPNWDGRRHQIRELAPDPGFWDEAEERVLGAMEAYAAHAAEGERILKRLFAEDAERGFAFIDLSRLRFDVILMNPPFGNPASGTKNALDEAYPAGGHEIYAMFFQRALELSEPHGRVGAITNRTWLALKGLQGLRETIFGKEGAVVLAADLGSFVLEAQVETAAVVIDRRASATTEATWVRLLKTSRKPTTLWEALLAAHNGSEHPYVFRAPASRFAKLPDGIYAYWMSDSLANRFSQLPAASTVIEAMVGTQATPDFRFLRLVWEVAPADAQLAAKWPRFAKGGEYRPFWDDIHLVLNWAMDGAEVKALGKGRPQNTGFFGRRGVTWPRRTTSEYGPRVFNDGCAFGDKGPVAFPQEDVSVLLGVLSSAPMRLILSVRLAAGDEQAGSAAKSYEVRLIKELPWPAMGDATRQSIRDATLRAIRAAREDQLLRDITAETCAAFLLPPLLRANRAASLQQLASATVLFREELLTELADATAVINQQAASAFLFSDRDLAVLKEEMEPEVAALPGDPAQVGPEDFRTAYLTKEPVPGDRLPGGLDAEIDSRVERRRRKQHASLRSEEELCHLFGIAPRALSRIRRDLGLLREEDVNRTAEDIVSWAVGAAFGRWDVRLLDHEDWAPAWSDPWGPLPVCPLGQLVDGRGLPASESRIASPAWWAARQEASALPRIVEREGVRWLADAAGLPTAEAEVTAAAYPLTVAWDGILQDDALEDGAPTRHPMDLSRRVQQVLERVWPQDHAAREAELAAALGADSLREWFRRPDSFFGDHLRRYSKSGRKAPIYWPLSSDDGLLTLWVYYPRLGPSMLAGLVNHLDKHLTDLRREADALELHRKQLRTSDTHQDRADKLAGAIESRTRMLNMLRGLVDHVWTPHPDDGAVINAGPLRELFRHRDWSKHVHEVWAKLEKGEHDWSHVARWSRPEAVLERCRTERDLALGHNRLDLYTEQQPARRRGRKKATQLALDAVDGGEVNDE